MISTDNVLSDFPQPPNGFDNQQWRGLIDKIKTKRCTPFLGAGACTKILPMGRTLAEEMTDAYPFEDNWNLMRVSQYVAVSREDSIAPHIQISTKWKTSIETFMDTSSKTIDSNTYSPSVHDLLARLKLPVYLTTNYDDLMERALKRTGQTEVVSDYCRWKPELEKRERFFHGDIEPSPDRPLVYHLHGLYTIPDSMVLTEDDYLEFISYSRYTQDEPMIPSFIEGRIATSTLLFLGYGLEDLNFRIIYQRLRQQITSNKHIAIQLPPLAHLNGQDANQRQLDAQRYLTTHYGNSAIRPVWMDCYDFLSSLFKAVGI